MLQKKPRIQPMSWSLTALLLAACGGGGGGGPELQRAVILASGQRQIDVAEGEVSARAEIFTPVEQASVTSDDISVRSVTVSSDGLTISVIYRSPHGDFASDFRVSGTDAKFFHFVERGNNGEDSTLEFRVPPDFENPQDHGQDNTYEIVVRGSFPSNVPYRPLINNVPGFVIRVTDRDDGPTTVASVASPLGQGNIPAHTREGDEIRITVEDGNREVFVINVGNLSLSDENLLAGPDAEKFQFKTVGFGGNRKAIIEFKDAPSTDTPADVGGDNIYNFELDGAAEDIYGDIKFEVEVV